MGNFSFGDYFKSEACAYAWEFVTGTLGLDPERLWVTVHISDDDAAAIWEHEIGVPPERIQRLDRDESTGSNSHAGYRAIGKELEHGCPSYAN